MKPTMPAINKTAKAAKAGAAKNALSDSKKLGFFSASGKSLFSLTYFLSARANFTR
ncbi:MAG TPA: hypothetical protein VGC97_25630 [Pyrinomonadaceae bacterium]